MYRPDEKDIDRLSREAAEHYHAPGKPSWDALQQVLDKELPQEEERKRRGFFFFFFLLLGLSLTGSVLWYGIQTGKNKQQPATAGVKDNSRASAIGSPASAAQPVAAAAPGNEAAQPPASDPAKNNNANSTGTAAGSNTDDAIVSSSAPADKTAGNISNKVKPAALQTSTGQPTNSPAGTAAADLVSAKKIRVTPAKSKKKINNTVFVSEHAIAAGSERTPAEKSNWQKITGDRKITVTGSPVNTERKHSHNGKKTFPPVTSTGNDKEDATGSNMVSSGSKADISTSTTATNNQQDNRTGSLANPPANTDSVSISSTTAFDSSRVSAIDANKKTDSAKAVRKKNTSKNNKSINIGLVAGTDISTVKFTYGDNAGYNFGLMAGYQFNRRWSVYTGIVYTKKNYKLEGSDYHPPKHYWTQYVKLQTVEGYCRMWELPLQARYTFNPGAKTAFFASAGLSSYFMKKQQYNYSYKNNMNQQLTAAWSNDSTFKHVFSILHLSAGFEKPLGKHMNWQIEPYAKIPLGGVGFGNIRLSSFGVNFSVQYRQRIRR